MAPDVFDLVNTPPTRSGATSDVFDLVNQPRSRFRPSLIPAAESTRQTGGVIPNPRATHLSEPMRSLTEFLVNPALENPLTTAASFALPPVGLYMAGQGAKRIVQYGAQKAAEATLPEDTRAIAEADPERISGREAATLAAAFAAAPLIHGGIKAWKGTPTPEVAPVETPAPTPSPFRIPANEAPARLAQAVRPQVTDAPVSTGAARDLIAQLDAILEANRVQPKEATPTTTEVFSEGYSTKSTRVGRRPAATVPSSGDVFDLVNERMPEETPAAPKAAESVPKMDEPIPTIGEPVSFGRDLAEPNRIPVDAPSVPRARGVEPSGTVATPEGVVSTGPSEGRALANPTMAPESVPVPMPEVGTGDLKTRGLSKGVAEKAVANKLTTSLGDLPEFRTVNMADQAARASKLLAEDGARAHRIALGDEAPPADLLPESVFVAVENKAIAEGDVGTLRALASGDLTSQATTMGQRIRTLAERDPESPVAAIQKIVEARTRGTKNPGAATEASLGELQRHIAEAAKMDPPAWTKFIDSLRC